MTDQRTEAELYRLRQSVGDSFNIYQATIAMVAIFIGFVFSGLLDILLSTESLTSGRVVVLWFLTLSMATLSFALVLFHATAHRVCRYWGVFYPVSVFNRIGALAFSAGLLLMFLCVGVLFWQHDSRALAALASLSGVGIVVFGVYFRRMHAGGQHMVNVDDPLPNRNEATLEHAITMPEESGSPTELPEGGVHLGTFNLAGKGPGTYTGGVFKLHGNPDQDLVSSADSFTEAADRALNGCRVDPDIPMLTVPGTMCAAFAVELYLKYVVRIEKGADALRTHRLAALFDACPDEVKSALREVRTDIQDVLERNDGHFVDARYHHEHSQFSFRQQELLQLCQDIRRFVHERYAE